MRNYLSTMADGLGPRFPEKVIWANMRLDAIMIPHELLQMPETTQVVLYNMNIVGIDWVANPQIVPAASHRTPFHLFVSGPEALQFRVASETTNRHINDPYHLSEHLSIKYRSIHNPYHKHQLSRVQKFLMLLDSE